MGSMIGAPGLVDGDEGGHRGPADGEGGSGMDSSAVFSVGCWMSSSQIEVSV